MNELTELLTVSRHTGYPTEYLLARLGARRITFAEKCGSAFDSDAWLILQREFCWLYRLMDNLLRYIYTPVFIHFEFNSLSTAIRFKSAGNIGGITNTIRHSLVCDRIKQILVSDKTFSENIRDLAEFLRPFHKNFAELEMTYRSKGLTGIENSLSDNLLDRVNAGDYPKIITDFLNAFEHRRHLLTLAKQKLWQLETPSQLLEDNKSKKTNLLKTLDTLQKKHPEVIDSPARLDALLLRTIKQKYQRIGRNREPFKQIISYICSCFFIARGAGLKPLIGLVDENLLNQEITA